MLSYCSHPKKRKKKLTSHAILRASGFIIRNLISAVFDANEPKVRKTGKFMLRNFHSCELYLQTIHYEWMNERDYFQCWCCQAATSWFIPQRRTQPFKFINIHQKRDRNLVPLRWFQHLKFNWKNIMKYLMKWCHFIYFYCFACELRERYRFCWDYVYIVAPNGLKV